VGLAITVHDEDDCIVSTCDITTLRIFSCDISIDPCCQTLIWIGRFCRFFFTDANTLMRTCAEPVQA